MKIRRLESKMKRDLSICLFAFLLLLFVLFSMGTEAEAKESAESKASVFELPFMASGCVLQEDVRWGNLSVRKENVQIPGIREKHTLFFLADSHISLCDETDPSLLEKANARRESFKSKDNAYAEESFSTCMEYIRLEKPDLLVLGGDITDSAMNASIQYVEGELSKCSFPYIYGMGNHDFEYGGEYFSPTAYETYLPRFENISDSQKGYELYEFSDLAVLVTDDASNRISQDALLALKSLVKRGKPTVVCVHVPFAPITGDDTLLNLSKEVWGSSAEGNSRVLIGPGGLTPDATTQEFMNLIMEDGNCVSLVLGGHVHFFHKDNLTENTVQIVSGAGYKKELIKVTILP